MNHWKLVQMMQGACIIIIIIIVGHLHCHFTPFHQHIMLPDNSQSLNFLNTQANEDASGNHIVQGTQWSETLTFLYFFPDLDP